MLTFIGKVVYTNKYFNYKLNFYECGFKNLTRKKISYEINYIMLVLFLLIYDGEFLILIPFAFNTSINSLSIFFCFLFFII
ncbi:MAG: NADH-quinone oxidoreductase subunit A [Nanoarchaeota archaeon]|nr:NADH-quinone oxidoreductase subunit A [Nanoarchaeota archaeon]